MVSLGGAFFYQKLKRRTRREIKKKSMDGRRKSLGIIQVLQATTDGELRSGEDRFAGGLWSGDFRE
jgi:hypothetical protein